VDAGTIAREEEESGSLGARGGQAFDGTLSRCANATMRGNGEVLAS
jgi:hypothetical protein